MAQPALPLIEKILYRAEKYDVVVETPTNVNIAGQADESSVGQALLAVIAWAHANGIDAEAALRAEALKLSEQVRAIEAR